MFLSLTFKKYILNIKEITLDSFLLSEFLKNIQNVYVYFVRLKQNILYLHKNILQGIL